jgi:phosphatidylglycerol---prolipoprotein diacylglyceryl transferase
MGPIIVDIDPVAFALGPIAVRWYGLAIAAGIAAGLYIAMREARRKGVAEDDILSLALWAVAAAFVGARLFHVADNWSFYAANPLAVFALHNGGLAILGGIMGGTLGGLIYARRRRLPLGRVADIAAPAIILGQAIGRLGCTINGDSLGLPTSLPWGFVYTHPEALAPSLGVAYQPTMLYEMGWDLAIFAFLWWGRKRFRPDGTLFLTYLTLYAVGKFAISFVRQEAVWLLGLQEAQIVSLALIAVTVPVLWALTRTRRSPAAA